MKSIYSAVIIALFFLSCKSPDKKPGDVINPDNGITENKNVQDTSKSQWPDNYYEGWMGDTSVRAFYTSSASSYSDSEKQNARIRLAWLMLLDSYSLNRHDMEIAERLASARLFEDMGKEHILHKYQQGKLTIFIQKSDPRLREQWNAALLTMEDKIPDLKEKRKEK